MQHSSRLSPHSGLFFGISVLASSMCLGAPIYDSGGFEPPSYVAGGSLAGQPVLDTTNKWVDQSSVSSTAGVGSFVLAYGGLSTNTQYAEVSVQNLDPSTDAAYFAPGTYLTNAYVATGQQIAVRFTMAFETGASNAFIGVTAFNGNDVLGTVGVNGSGKITGATLTAAGSAFTATQYTFYQYELLLDYVTHTASIFEAPADNSTPYVLFGTSTFSSSDNAFTDADLTISGTGTNLISGAGFYDYYSIQTVPEPVGCAVMALSLLGMGLRRRGQ